MPDKFQREVQKGRGMLKRGCRYCVNCPAIPRVDNSLGCFTTIRPGGQQLSTMHSQGEARLVDGEARTCL